MMQDMKETIKSEIKESIEVKNLVLKNLPDKIEQAARLMTKALSQGGKIIFFGNGGSAADAQHLAAELIGRYRKERRALAAISLTTDTSVLTSLSNDYGFDTVFARQIEGLAKAGDVAFGISTSGNSPNVLEGMVKAREIGCKTIALLGGDGGRLAGAVDLALTIPCKNTPHIQESHIMIGHILCGLIEDASFGG